MGPDGTARRSPQSKRGECSRGVVGSPFAVYSVLKLLQPEGIGMGLEELKQVVKNCCVSYSL